MIPRSTWDALHFAKLDKIAYLNAQASFVRLSAGPTQALHQSDCLILVLEAIIW